MSRIGRALLIVISLLATPALAQGPGTRFGAILGGATLSDLAGFSLTSNDRWGGTAGFLVGMNTWRTSVAFEGDWIQKGGGNTKLDYLEFPLTIGGVTTMAAGAMRGRFYTGLSVGFKLSCSSPNLDCDAAKGTEWGWPIGIQVARVMETGSFVGLDVKYTVALSDAFDFNGIYNRPWVFRLMFGKALGMSSR